MQLVYFFKFVVVKCKANRWWVVFMDYVVEWCEVRGLDGERIDHKLKSLTISKLLIHSESWYGK